MGSAPTIPAESLDLCSKSFLAFVRGIKIMPMELWMIIVEYFSELSIVSVENGLQLWNGRKKYDIVSKSGGGFHLLGRSGSLLFMGQVWSFWLISKMIVFDIKTFKEVKAVNTIVCDDFLKHQNSFYVPLHNFSACLILSSVNHKSSYIYYFDRKIEKDLIVHTKKDLKFGIHNLRFAYYDIKSKLLFCTWHESKASTVSNERIESIPRMDSCQVSIFLIDDETRNKPDKPEEVDKTKHQEKTDKNQELEQNLKITFIANIDLFVVRNKITQLPAYSHENCFISRYNDEGLMMCSLDDHFYIFDPQRQETLLCMEFPGIDGMPYRFGNRWWFYVPDNYPFYIDIKANIGNEKKLKIYRSSTCRFPIIYATIPVEIREIPDEVIASLQTPIIISFA